MFRKLLLSTVLTVGLYAESWLTPEQIIKIQDSYTIGKTIVADDGTTFENTLPSIMGQESSFGKYVIGDNYDSTGRLKSVYESSLGNFQIKLETAKITIMKNPELKEKYGYMVNTGKSVYIKYEKHKKKLDYYNKVLNNSKWIERYNNGEKKAIATMKWAEKERTYHKTFVDKLKKQTIKDKLLINRLFSDHKFGAEIAGHYIKDIYNHALKKGWSKTYLRSVGRYNGGWYNWNYAKLVMKRMKIVRKLVRKGKIS
jgi:hypothetical protein